MNLTTLGQVVAALLILDNAVDAILELFGNTKWETRLTLLARWLKTIEGNLPKVPPAAIFLLIFFATFNVQAQTTTTTTVTPPQITTIMDGITADVGTGWDVRNKTWVQTDTVRFLEYKQTNNTGKYSTFLNFVGNVDPAASIGYDTANKITVGGSFNLFVPKNWGLTSPLLSVVDISPFVQYELVSMGNVPSQTKKGLIFGAYIIKGSA